MIALVIWICIAGLVFGIAGWLGVFIMPLLFIGWKYWQRQSVEGALLREEKAMDAIIAQAKADDRRDAVVRDLYEMRALIRTNLPLYLTQAAVLKAAFQHAAEGEPDDDDDS